MSKTRKKVNVFREMTNNVVLTRNILMSFLGKNKCHNNCSNKNSRVASKIIIFMRIVLTLYKDMSFVECTCKFRALCE